MHGRYVEAHSIAKSKKDAQDAHEAIRPTSALRTPESLEKYLDEDALKLYRLIWMRFIASQMTPAVFDQTTIDVNAPGKDSKTYLFRATGSVPKFDGFLKVYEEGKDQKDEEDEELKHKLPAVTEGEVLKFKAIEPEQHFTEPPPRFTEATLVKELEKHGIGRPSTYAAIIERIQEREYVERDRENRLRATRLGETVCDLLTTHFTAFVDLGFTAGMEEELDAVAEGRADWRDVLGRFWSEFEPLVNEKKESIGAGDFRNRPSEEKCSEGHAMTERLGRFGWYLACSLYPEHSERRSLPKVIGDDAALDPAVQLEGVGTACPACGTGKLAQRRSRFGYFLGCDRYPECRFIPKPEVPEEHRLAFDAACPVCGPEHGGKLGPRRNNKRNTYFYSCDRYPDCKTIRPRPTGATHEGCGAVIGRDDSGGICTRCGARVELPEGDFVGRVIAGGDPDPSAFLPKRPQIGRAHV